MIKHAFAFLFSLSAIYLLVIVVWMALVVILG